MTQFHEGQDVEVLRQVSSNAPIGTSNEWRKAKVIKIHYYTYPSPRHDPQCFDVKYPDGTRALIRADHIRTEYAQTYKPE